jgi:putative ABC transport system permease protein
MNISLDLVALALRNVSRHKARSAMTLASIVFGVVSLILAGGFIEDTIIEVGESMIHSYSGHIQVAEQGYFQFGSQRPERYWLSQSSRLKAELETLPHVKDVLMRLSFNGLVSNGRTDWPVIGEGVEPEGESRLGSYITLVSGRQLAGGHENGIMIGQGVATALNLEPGEFVTLLVSTASGAANSLEFEVVGVFQTFSKDYDARAIRLPLRAAQDLLATEGAHVAVLSLDSTDQTALVADKIIPLAGAGREVRTWIDLNDFYTSTVTLYRQQFGFLVAIIVVMLVLSVANTVNMGIYERLSEFGTMRAIGDRPDQIVALIVAENFLLGLAGAGAGVGLGMYLAWQISVFGIPMPPPPNADLGYLSHILIVPRYIALSFLAGVSSCLIAAYFPARRVSRIDISEALRSAV